MPHIFVISKLYITFTIRHAIFDIFCTSASIVQFLHRFLVSHLTDLVSEVDLKEIVEDSLIHSFRSVPTFRSCSQLSRLVVSIILDVSSFSVSPTFLETSYRMS